MELKWQDYNKQKWRGIIQKEGRHGDKKSDVLGAESPWSPSSGEWGTRVSLGSQLLAPVQMFSWWSSSQAPSMSFSCSRRWQEESRKEEAGRCQVLTTAGKWVWLGPKLLTYDYCQPFPSTDWLKRNLTFLCPPPTEESPALSVPFFRFSPSRMENWQEYKIREAEEGPCHCYWKIKEDNNLQENPVHKLKTAFFSFLFFFFFNSKRS